MKMITPGIEIESDTINSRIGQTHTRAWLVHLLIRELYNRLFWAGLMPMLPAVRITIPMD